MQNAISVVCWLLLPVDGIKVTSVSVLTRIVISNFSKVHIILWKSMKWFLSC
jgi:hypothetical protein